MTAMMVGLMSVLALLTALVFFSLGALLLRWIDRTIARRIDKPRGRDIVGMGMLLAIVTVIGILFGYGPHSVLAADLQVTQTWGQQRWAISQNVAGYSLTDQYGLKEQVNIWEVRAEASTLSGVRMDYYGLFPGNTSGVGPLPLPIQIGGVVFGKDAGKGGSQGGTQQLVNIEISSAIHRLELSHKLTFMNPVSLFAAVQVISADITMTSQDKNAQSNNQPTSGTDHVWAGMIGGGIRASYPIYRGVNASGAWGITDLKGARVSWGNLGLTAQYRNVGLTGGYRWWQASFPLAVGSISNRGAGPFVGLLVEF